MIKKITLSVVCALLINTLSVAQWVSIDDNSIPDSKPNVQLISDDITGTVINIELPGFRINEFNAEGKTYHSIDLSSLGITTEVGRPEIPHIAKVLAIPNQGTISVEVLETGESKIIKGINIPPARESWIEGKPETPYLENEESYSSANLYPQEIVRVEDPAIFRDFRIARVSIFPIRYSPAKQEIEAYSSITIRVNYGSGIGANPKLTPKKPIAPSFDKLYKSFIFNYDEVLQREYSGDVEGHDIMLCITPDIFFDDFQPYADWKHKSGTEIFITKFSEIGATQSDPQPIKDHIQNVYNTWLNPPTHILLNGDYGTITGCVPREEWASGWQGYIFAVEDWFVELAGNDYFPEMMIGRWTHHPNAGLERLQIMVDKYIQYEKYPATTGNDWYKKGIVCSNNYYASQIQTKRETAQKMMQYGNFISVDTMMMVYPSGSPCPYNLADVKAAINSGRSFLNYRGEGWSSGWWAGCYQFGTSDVSTLTNYNKLTFVTSIGCGVAMFDEPVQCFGEEWIEMGTLGGDPVGGCAFIGPTSNTHTAWNNRLDKGIYTGMFVEGLDSPGEALLRGKLQMYIDFGNTFEVEYHFKVYCILGDPSLHIWKDLPRVVSVNYTDTVGIGFNQVQVVVTDSSSGLPVEDAQVCISGDSVYAVGQTSTGGTLTLDITTFLAGELDLVVRGGTVAPFEGSIQVVDSVASTFQLTVIIEDDWNMTSIPGLHPTNQDVTTWWPNLTSSVFKFNGGYMPVTTVAPTEGYWMNNSGAETYNYPAIEIVNHDPISANTGWNMIGGYENSAATSGLTTTPPGLISGTIFGYSAGYFPATNLVPGYGYWIKLTGAGSINIPTGPLAKGSVEVVEYIQDDWGKIIITDNAGRSFTLYAVNDEINLDNYELPPVPPSGMFDIRYDSDRIAEDINSSIQSVEMSGIEYPITIKVEGMDIRLQDETGNEINENIKSGEAITISNTSINKLMVTGEMIPDEYSLEQNYPNPFNPSTTIEFSLPEVSNVQLTIYDALGQKVTQLVNTSLQAGRYSYQWEVRNVSTGVYFYELRTDNFTSIKKMMILK